jgi:hypothetical protein
VAQKYVGNSCHARAADAPLQLRPE